MGTSLDNIHWTVEHTENVICHHYQVPNFNYEYKTVKESF